MKFLPIYSYAFEPFEPDHLSSIVSESFIKDYFPKINLVPISSIIFGLTFITSVIFVLKASTKQMNLLDLKLRIERKMLNIDNSSTIAFYYTLFFINSLFSLSWLVLAFGVMEKANVLLAYSISILGASFICNWLTSPTKAKDSKVKSKQKRQ